MKYFFKVFKSIIILFIVLILLVTINTYVKAGEQNIIINEVLFDPIGTDTGYEWIEIYNPNDFDIAIVDWKILVAGSTFKEVSIFSGLIPSNEYFLICEEFVQGCNTYVEKLTFQNGGTSTDGIRISDSANNILDEVFYDSPNTSGLTDMNDVVVANEMSALIGVSGESIGRIDFKDSDNSFDDFLVFNVPTPGDINIGKVENGELPNTGDSPLNYFLLILSISGILLFRNNLDKYIDAKNKQKSS
jgi:hypothetical protein